MSKSNCYFRVFTCNACNCVLSRPSQVTDNFGYKVCPQCSCFSYDATRWNDAKAWSRSNGQYIFDAELDDASSLVVCENCGAAPYDETDGVTTDNFGHLVCQCSGKLYVAECEDK